MKDTVDEGNYTLLYSGCGTVGDYVGETVKDTVDEGNYTYYTLKQPGPLELVLTTFQGNTLWEIWIRNNRQSLGFVETLRGGGGGGKN